MQTYNTLREACAARSKFWNASGQELPLSFKGVEMAGEVGEACNIIKKLERERYGMPGSRSTLEALGNELADVIITVELVAKAAGINMSDYVSKVFNAKSDELGFPVHLELK